MLLLVGLGNPGARYAQTRHNAGFRVVDRVAERAGVAVDKKAFGALVGEAQVGDRKVLLVQPQQFMNVSGQAVLSLMGFYKLERSALIVACDDMDLPFGRLRLRETGGHGGHNGIRDIQRVLGGNDFARLRVGVGRPPEGWDAADYVLGSWTPAEAGELPTVVDRAADAFDAIVRDGFAKAMNQFNLNDSAASGASAQAPLRRSA
jgi:PTH1 family peptidyl-tRNA hydrolase